MKRQINDLLLKMQTGENCIGETANALVKLYSVSNSNCVDLKQELEVTNKLLNERQRVLDAIPECQIHGKCVPHAIEWVEEMKANDGNTYPQRHLIWQVANKNEDFVRSVSLFEKDNHIYKKDEPIEFTRGRVVWEEMKNGSKVWKLI
jgi:hypothetical protein